jgi:hypothetical protein
VNSYLLSQDVVKLSLAEIDAGVEIQREVTRNEAAERQKP